MHELDRVFDREDVQRTRAVDEIDERGERGALAAARDAGHEHEAARLVGQLDDRAGEPEGGQCRHGRRNETHRHADGAALTEHAGAAASDAGGLPGDVDFEMGLQPLLMDRGQQALRKRLEVGGAEHLDLSPALEDAVNTHEGHVPRAKVDIRSATLGGQGKEGVKGHEPPG